MWTRLETIMTLSVRSNCRNYITSHGAKWSRPLHVNLIEKKSSHGAHANTALHVSESLRKIWLVRTVVKGHRWFGLSNQIECRASCSKWFVDLFPSSYPDLAISNGGSRISQSGDANPQGNVNLIFGHFSDNSTKMKNAWRRGGRIPCALPPPRIRQWSMGRGRAPIPLFFFGPDSMDFSETISEIP